jgi:hypothetical protein
MQIYTKKGRGQGIGRRLAGDARQQKKSTEKAGKEGQNGRRSRGRVRWGGGGGCKERDTGKVDARSLSGLCWESDGRAA